MNCEFTSGHINECDYTAGVNSWVALSFKDLESYSIIDGEINAISIKKGKSAYRFEVQKETSSFTVTSIGERTNSAHALDINASTIINNNTKETVDLLNTIAKDRTIWIAELNDGTHEILFLDFGGKLNFVRSSGTALEDLQGNTITITGKSNINPPKISSQLVDDLINNINHLVSTWNWNFVTTFGDKIITV